MFKEKSFRDKYLNEESFKIYNSDEDLAHHLNYEIVAEGIENAEDLNLLKKTKCIHAQRHYFSKPKKDKEIFKDEKNV